MGNKNKKNKKMHSCIIGVRIRKKDMKDIKSMGSVTEKIYPVPNTYTDKDFRNFINLICVLYSNNDNIKRSFLKKMFELCLNVEIKNFSVRYQGFDKIKKREKDTKCFFYTERAGKATLTERAHCK